MMKRVKWRSIGAPIMEGTWGIYCIPQVPWSKRQVKYVPPPNVQVRWPTMFNKVSFPKKDQTENKSFQQRYGQEDLEIGTLGESSGGFDYHVWYLKSPSSSINLKDIVPVGWSEEFDDEVIVSPQHINPPQHVDHSKHVDKPKSSHQHELKVPENLPEKRWITVGKMLGAWQELISGDSRGRRRCTSSKSMLSRQVNIMLLLNLTNSGQRTWSGKDSWSSQQRLSNMKTT